MRSIRDLGIRARLVLLTTAAVAPLVLLLAGGIAYSYADALERAKIDIHKTAEIAAGRLSHTFQDARARLDMVRNLAEVRRSSGQACDAFLTALQKANPQFVTIGLVDREGRTVCSGQIGAGAALTDRELIATVMAMGPDGFVASVAPPDLETGHSTVLTAMPLAYVRGAPTGLMFAAINLDHLRDAARELSANGRRSVLLVETATARVLARWPHPVPFGTPMPEHPILSFLERNPAGGVAELVDLDGTPRIFGAAPVEEAGASGIVFVVGEPRAATIAVVNLRSLMAVLLTLLTLGLAILAASWLGSEMLVRPMRRLVRMASAIGLGRLDARTEIEGWQAPEFRELGTTLDAMAVRLGEGREAEKAVAASEARYRLLADNTADMITCIGPDGLRTFVSGASLDLLGYRPDELLGQPASAVAHPEDTQIMAELGRRLRSGENAPAVRYRARHRDGRYVWVDVSGRRLGDGTELVFAMRDASHRKAMEDHLEAVNERLARLAATDDLTGLPNRRTFNEALGLELARCASSGAPISLVLLDVDRFKAFNDGYGHQAGDLCLKRVAAAIGRTIGGAGALVARYGGEEFVALLPETSVAQAMERAEAMRQAVRALAIPHDGSEHGRVTISMGVASLSEAGGEDATAIILRQADQALYVAKARGRDAIEAYVEETADRVRQSA